MTQPRKDRFGITPEDWRVLEILGANRERLASQFQRWFDAGYITPEEGESIWYELDNRLKAYQYNIPREEAAITQAREAGEVEEAIKAEEWRTRPIGMKLTPERYTEYVKSEAWKGAQPEAEYGPTYTALGETFRGEIPQTETWLSWFSSRYPSIVAKFEATQPKFERVAYPGLSPEEASEKREKGWAEYLRSIKPQITREWYKQSPYARGERPGVYAPRIQKVGFG